MPKRQVSNLKGGSLNNLEVFYVECRILSVAYFQGGLSMQKTALLIIDVQNAMFHESNPIYDGEQLLKNLQELINRARTVNIPVFLFNIMMKNSKVELLRGRSILQLLPMWVRL